MLELQQRVDEIKQFSWNGSEENFLSNNNTLLQVKHIEDFPILHSSLTALTDSSNFVLTTRLVSI
jgi:hypothetical protein